MNHDTLVRSFSIAHYYRYQAIYGFSVNAPDGNIVKAEKIIQIFKTKEIRQGLKSELYHSCRCNLFPSAKDFYSALDTLAEYGYVAYENVTAANNKKAQMVYVNPNIRITMSEFIQTGFLWFLWWLTLKLRYSDFCKTQG